MTTTHLNSHVLVLTKHFEPLRVVDAATALCKLFRGVAEAIEVDAERMYGMHDFESWSDLSEFAAEFEEKDSRFISTTEGKLLVPTVIRSLKAERRRNYRIRMSRKNIYHRDNHVCQYCGKQFDTRELNLDHVTPKGQGGKSTWTNLVCSCIKCNTKKACRTPKQAGMKLIREPKKLTRAPIMSKMRYDSWAHFVEDAYWNVELKD